MTGVQNQSMSVRISRGLVTIYKEEFGRGPKRARTIYDDDVLTVVLEDSLTDMEHSLADNGKEEIVNQMRDGFQAAVCKRMVDFVEIETGRTVKAFMSDHSVYPDYAVEVFILDGQGGDEDPC